MTEKNKPATDATLSEKTSAGEVTNSKISEAYRRAEAEGKGVMYVCVMGTSRSKHAKYYAVRRGEKNSHMLEGGSQFFYRQNKDKNDEEIIAVLAELCQENKLRLFSDEAHSMQWLLEKLQLGVEEGNISETDFEVIDFRILASELRKGGEDITTLMRAMLND